MRIHGEAPEVYIDSEALAKLRAWTNYAEGEVSGLGLVDIDRNEGRVESLEVTEVFIVDQECSTSATELDSAAVARLLVTLEGEGRSDQLRLWWHSHADMAVFWSPTDEANINRLGNQDFLLSIVLNKAWDMLVRLDWFVPARITLDGLRVDVLLPDYRVADRCRRQVQELVREAKPPQLKSLLNERPTCARGIGRVDEVMADPFGYLDEWALAQVPFLAEAEE